MPSGRVHILFCKHLLQATRKRWRIVVVGTPLTSAEVHAILTNLDSDPLVEDAVAGCRATSVSDLQWLSARGRKLTREAVAHNPRTPDSVLRCLLLVEAAQVSVRSIIEWRNKYVHLAMRRGNKIAKVAMARRLAVRLYWMWRNKWDYEEIVKFGRTWASSNIAMV